MTPAIVAGLMALAVTALAQDPAALPAPRWPDGHVNLGSTPDQKGYWELRPGGTRNEGPRASAIPLKPWARALAEYRQSQTALYPPGVACKPTAGPGFFNSPGFEIVEVPEMQKVFILNIAGPHSWRVVYMDGRGHPDPGEFRPSYLGHSIGHWEGDTLVIDSVGFNEKQWVSGVYPTTTQLHLIERLSRPTFGSFVYEVTIDDPGAYTDTWSRKWTIDETTSASWIQDGEMFEYICQEGR